tara:strand:- start:821 stop:1363 length:543 start_codon:yes stop_codon:yes gene_type:complete
LDSHGLAGGDRSELIAIRDSAATWSEPGCSALVIDEEEGGVQADPRGGFDRLNQVWFEGRAARWTYGSGTLGVTLTTFMGNGCRVGRARPRNDCTIVDADILFNAVHHGDRWTTSDPPAPNGFDLESVSLHEFGHFLGLDHPCERCSVDAIMSPSIGLGDKRRTLFAGDHAAVCAMFPAD